VHLALSWWLSAWRLHQGSIAVLQGRFSFYMTSSGEEATAIGSAAALTLDDVVTSLFACFNIWRGGNWG
jgi:TPP-dependent pyruvate/acetoin dehydrogenase alpha subunit